MFLSSVIEELCTKEENNKADCALTFGGQYRIFMCEKKICVLPKCTELEKCVCILPV